MEGEGGDILESATCLVEVLDNRGADAGEDDYRYWPHTKPRRGKSGKLGLHFPK